MPETLIDAVTEYGKGKEAEVATFLATIRAHGAIEEDLDMIVHDLADGEGFDSEDASRLNNEGIELQAAAALMALGSEEAEKAVQEAIAERRQMQP